MQRGRSSRRTTAPRAKIPWGVTTRVVNIAAATGTTQETELIYQSSNVSGVTPLQKIKNITISLNTEAASATPVFWALVYVPAGYAVSMLNLAPNVEMYNPRQFVIAAGSFIADADSEPVRIFTRLARKLNPGDAIFLATLSPLATAYQAIGTVRFAVKS